MKIGDEVFVHGYVDEIRKDCIIIRNNGGYFGTVPTEIVESDGEEYKRGRLDALSELKAYIREMGTYDTADTPQTDCDKCIWNVCNYNKVDWDADTPQTEICDTCKYRSSNVFGNWCVGRDTCDRYEADTPQTERMTEEEFDTMLAKALVGQTDCGWK